MHPLAQCTERTAAVLLNRVQDYLSGLYETPTSYDIYDFLITDANAANALTPEGHHANDERLLVAEHDDGVDISVYVDAATLDALADDDPFDGLHAGNLPPFLLALEGVSHFNYLCWNAGFDKSVTLLELELQAEVDKYVIARALFDAQGDTVKAETLQGILFDRVRFHADLDGPHRDRYEHANRYARKYCLALGENFPDTPESPELQNELRRFYRLTQNGKIRRIEAAG